MWFCVFVGFVICGCVYVWVCVCVGFVMCGYVYVWVLYCVVVCMCGFCNMWDPELILGNISKFSANCENNFAIAGRMNLDFNLGPPPIKDTSGNISTVVCNETYLMYYLSSVY
jgi:hypothetical protein